MANNSENTGVESIQTFSIKKLERLQKSSYPDKKEIPTSLLIKGLVADILEQDKQSPLNILLKLFRGTFFKEKRVRKENLEMLERSNNLQDILGYISTTELQSQFRKAMEENMRYGYAWTLGDVVNFKQELMSILEGIDREGKNRVYNINFEIGEQFRYNSEYEKSNVFYLRALNGEYIIKELWLLLNMIAENYTRLGEYEKSNEYLFKALDNRVPNDKFWSIYWDIGTNYFFMQEHGKANEYLLKAKNNNPDGYWLNTIRKQIDMNSQFI